MGDTAEVGDAKAVEVGCCVRDGGWLGEGDEDGGEVVFGINSGVGSKICVVLGEGVGRAMPKQTVSDLPSFPAGSFA